MQLAMMMMMWAVALAVAAVTVTPTEAAKWAVLVCGSRGYWNYRHHADVCHAYHSLRARGIPEENIITMLYDDVAHDRRNPFPGQLFNRPTGSDGSNPVDVYAGCKKDYTGKQVTVSNFLSLLVGDSEATGGLPVLKSTAEDDVFINFVDHGAPGLVAMPSGELYATDLLKAMETMFQKKMYRNLVFYLEACESGSMFPSLPEDRNVWALTAANAHESSYATYCPPRGDMVNGHHMNSCLGDEFSVHWMEDMDAEHPGQNETLKQQFQRVKGLTKESHVLDFGDLVAMSADDIDEFLGAPPADGPVAPRPQLSEEVRNSRVDARDAPLVSKFYAYQRDPTESNAHQLAVELQHRRDVDAVFEQVATHVLSDPRQIDEVLHAPRADAAQNVDCHRFAHTAFRSMCMPGGQWSDYALKYSASLLALCEKLGESGEHQIRQAIMATCLGGTPQIADVMADM